MMLRPFSGGFVDCDLLANEMWGQHEMSSGSSPAAVESGVTRRRTDIAWNHCSKAFGGGGIHRMKKHLANVKGDVTPYEKVSLNVLLDVKADSKGNAPMPLTLDSRKRQLTS
ncbi:hypothetical protein ACLOJK_025349 [Asimina triloba]